MGTSSPRRGPTSRFWRAAKRTATRYLAREGGSPVTAREVVGRYVAALGESAGGEVQDKLAAFRLIRKVAQNLGDFGQKVASQGWEGALADAGLQELAGQPLEVLVQGLAAALVETDGGLEEAVARTSLATLWQSIFRSQEISEQALAADLSRAYLAVDPARLVSRFLAAAFYQRLVLDLGESLEAAVAGWLPYKTGLEGIRTEIDQAAEAAAGEHAPPRRWQGLSGWTWVTRFVEGMLQEFPETAGKRR